MGGLGSKFGHKHSSVLSLMIYIITTFRLNGSFPHVDGHNNYVTTETTTFNLGKIPNKALTKSSTNSSRAEMILRAKKIEKQSNAKSKLIVEQQLLKKSATQESTLSGLIA